MDTIKEDGPYAPFTRPVFTYLNEERAQENPAVLDFAIFAMKQARAAAKETGFAPLPEEELQASINDLESLQKDESKGNAP